MKFASLFNKFETLCILTSNENIHFKLDYGHLNFHLRFVLDTIYVLTCIYLNQARVLIASYRSEFLEVFKCKQVRVMN